MYLVIDTTCHKKVQDRPNRPDVIVLALFTVYILEFRVKVVEINTHDWGISKFVLQFDQVHDGDVADFQINLCALLKTMGYNDTLWSEIL